MTDANQSETTMQDTKKAEPANANVKEKEKKSKTFESSLARLDEIVHLLESENLALDDMMKYYEEGVELLRLCNDRLDKAEQKVKLLRISEDGK